MSKKELRKLNRAELLELLVAQTERADRFEAELAEAKEEIRNRERLINQAGNLAAEATRLLKILEVEPVDVRAAAGAASGKPARSAVKPAPAQKPRTKGKNNETNGIDVSAIIAITSGIGKGKI